MRSLLPPPLERLVRVFTRLPAIGEKSASRLAYHLVSKDREGAHLLSKAIEDALSQISECSRCYSLATGSICSICSDSTRDSSVLCVVEKAADVIAIERIGEFGGIYHVLRGVWSPLGGMSTTDLTIEELSKRLLEGGGVEEVILATSATIEGDATALYVRGIISKLGIKCSRLAQGIPKGGELEFTDELTLSRAFSARSLL
jgi:recombination protein RecR